MSYTTENIIFQIIWASVVVFLLGGVGYMIVTFEAARHEREMTCIEARGVLTKGGDCVFAGQTGGDHDIFGH